MAFFRKSSETGDTVLAAYLTASRLLSPSLYLLLQWRRFKKLEHDKRWRERMGQTRLGTFLAPTVWVHAASVGEFNAILPLVHELARMGLGVVVTTITQTSARIAEKRLPEGAIHQFAPMDTPRWLDRFLDHWQPQLAITVESEVWPATLCALNERNIPSVLVNARMSERSLRGWMRLGSLRHAVFGKFRLCLAQTDTDADRYRELGVLRVMMAGNLKFDAAAAEASEVDAEALIQSTLGRPVFLAASTHPGEEEQFILPAGERLATRVPRLLVAIAPRHPDRSDEIRRLGEARGYRIAVRSRGELPDSTTTLYIADTIGEMGTLYRWASVAFVGGSFVPRGGHNPIEPAITGTPIITGPHVSNFEDIYRALETARGVTITGDVADLVEATERLLLTRVHRDRQIRSAEEVVSKLRGGLERTLTALRPFIEPLMLSHRLAARQQPDDGQSIGET